MSGLLPPSLSDELAELRRRVDRLENSSRVPQISRLAGGIQADTIDTFTNVTAPLTESYTPVPGGPDFEVQVRETGRLLWILQTQNTLEDDSEDLIAIYTSVELVGPTNVPGSDTFATWQWRPDPLFQRLIRVHTVTGLEPGPYTVRMVMKHYGTKPDLAGYDHRSLVVLPL